MFLRGKKTPNKLKTDQNKLYARHFFSVYYYNQSPLFLSSEKKGKKKTNSKPKQNEGISFLTEV